MTVRRLAPEALAALEAGDTQALLAFQHERFGGWRMMADPADDPDDPDDEDEDEPDDEDDDDTEYVPPTKAEWKATQDALKKANSQAKRARFAAKKAAEARPTDSSAEVQKAITETETKWRPRLVNKAAKAALLAAGASKPDRLVKLIDHDDLDIDEDGEVVGLEAAVDEIKEDYPELFKAPADEEEDKTRRRPRRRPGSSDAGSSNGRPSTRTKSSAERIASGLAGSSH